MNAARPKREWQTWQIVVGVTGAVLIGLFFLVGALAPPVDPMERIKQACEAQFGTADELRVLECTNQIALEHIAQAEAGKMERARRSAR